MKKGEIIFVVCLAVAIGVCLGVALFNMWYNDRFEHYDLQNCIYNNAAMNGFPKHPEMARKIQEECICFREHGYENLLEAECQADSFVQEAEK